MHAHFINLTNGIEAMPQINDQFQFIRIQSTACEQKRWDFIIQELDYTFLLALALGKTCIIYDFGARKKVSRALYQGVEWIQYAINRRWFGITVKPVVRGHNTSKYFDEIYNQLDNRTLKKLDYVKKFVNTESIKIEVVASSTNHDGDIDFYRSILFESA